MKKLITAFIAALSIGSIALSGQTINMSEEGRYSISVGEATMVIDAEEGGKIVSFKYEDQEILSQSTRQNSYGSTFWTSPQAEWNWPPVAEYDKNPYKAEINDDVLILTGEKSEKHGYRIRKAFKADPKDGSIVITYTIINESGEARVVAPWEITRVQNGGIVFFDAKEVVPANRMKGLPFEFRESAAWYTLDEVRATRKINADGKGWIAFCDKGLMFIKKFQDLKASEAAPKEAEIQIYVNPGKTYVEIENQGAYTSLESGEGFDWTVRWYLIPEELPAEPSKKLLKRAKQTIR